MGSSTPLGALTINSAHDVTADSTFTARSITQTTGEGQTHFDSAVNTAGAADTVGGVVNITTAGDIQFDSTITTTGGISSAGNVGRAGGAVTLHSTGGAITVDGAINTSGSDGNDDGLAATGKIGGAGGAITITADNGDVEVDAITTNGGDGSGIITNANGGVGGAVTITSTGKTTTLHNNISTVGGIAGAFGGTPGAGGTVTLNSAVELDDDISIDTGATAGNIVFNNTINGTYDLDLTAGTGSITLGNIVGGVDRLAALTIHSAGNVVAAAINAASITQVAGTGTTTFNGALNTNTSSGINLTGNAFTFNQPVTTTAGGPVTITNTSTLTIAAAADMILDGAFTQNGASTVSIAGDITTTNDAISFAKGVTLTGPVALNTVSLAGPGAGITFGSTLTGAQNLTLTAGAADILFTGAVGATQLGDILINSAHDLTASSTFTAKSITHTAGTGTVHFVGAVNTVGATNAPGGAIDIATTGNINFDSTIATTGGAAGLGKPGQNGGNVNLHSTNGAITVASTITASGSNGRGDGVAGQPGGNAGTVTLTADDNAVVVAAITTNGGAGHGGTGGFIADGGNAGAVTITSTGNTTTLNGNITAVGGTAANGGTQGSGANITLNSPVILGAGIIINTTGSTAGSISFINTLNGTADYTQSLGLTAGTGDILFNGAVGNSIPLGAVTINSANDVTADSTFTARSITQTTGEGQTHFDSAVNTAGAADTVGGVVNITTAGDIQFDSTITTTGGISSAGNVGRAGGAVTLHSTGGAITVDGAINTSGSDGVDSGAAGKVGGAGGAITITADNGDVEVAAITTNGGDGSGIITNANGGVGGAVTITSTGETTTLHNDISTVGGAKGAFGGTPGAGGTVTLNNPTLLNTNIAIDTGATAGNIVFNNTINGTYDLDLTAGTGSITLGNIVGGVDRLAALTIHSAGNVVAAAINAASITQVAGTGTTTFNGALNTNTSSGINLTGNAFTFNQPVTTTAGGPVTITNASTLTIAAAADMILEGAFTQNGVGAVSIAGDITTTNNAISFAKAVTLTGPVVLNTVSAPGTGADITFGSTLTGAQNLTLTAGAADILFTGAVGATQLGDVLINSAHDLTASSTFTAKSITHTAGTGTVHFVGAVNTVGATNAPGGAIDIATTGNINFDSTIATTGGAAGLGKPGQNGGNVNLHSTNGAITVASTITASGSNGRGDGVAGQPGGNAGTVTLTADDNAVVVAAITTNGGAGHGGTGGFIADGGNAGAVTITSTGNTTTLNGNITAVGGTAANGGTQGSGANITLNSPVILGAGIIINTTGSTAGNITFNDTLNGTGIGAQTLGLTAGTGNIVFTGAVGGATRLGTLTINSAKNVTANAITAAAIIQSAGTGTTTFNGALDTNTAADINLTGNAFIFNAPVTTTIGGIVEVTNAGLLTIAESADMDLDGSFTQNGTGSVLLAGDIATSNDAISFLSPVTLTGNVALDTGAGVGNITFSSTVDGTYNLDLTADTGSITFGNTVGTTPLGALTIHSATNVTAAAITAASIVQSDGTGTTTLNGPVDVTAGLDITNIAFTQNAAAAINAHASAISITTDTIALNANITGTSTITLQPVTLNRSIGIGNGAAGSFNLTSTEIAYLQPGFSQITVGRADGTGSIDIHTITFADPITIRSPGLAGNITVNGIFSTAVANAAISFIAGTGDNGIFTQIAGALNSIASGSGSITITADSITLNTSPNTIIGTGAIRLQPSSVDRPIVIGAAGLTSDFALSVAEIAALQNGFSLITIGRDDGTGGVNVAGPVTFYDPVVIKSPAGGTIQVNGQITGLDNASIEFDGTGSTMTLNANIITSGSPIIINDSVVLGTPASITLDTTNGGGSLTGADISITGTVNDDANPSSLVLTAGTIGDVTIDGVIGGSTAISGDLTITGHNISLNDIGTLVAGIPNVGVAGNVSAISSGLTPLITFTGTNYYTTGSQTYNAGAANIIQLAGGVAGSTVQMGTQGNAVSFTGKVDMNDRIFGIDTTFNGVVPAGNNITFNQSINDLGGIGTNSALWLNGGTAGNVNLSGAVGDTDPLASLTVANAALLDLNDVATTGAQSYAAANIHLNGVSYTGSILGGSPISFTGPVSLNAAGPIAVTTGLGAGDDITFSSSIDGVQNLTLSAGAGDVEIDGAVGTGIALSSLTASGNNATLNAVSTTGSQSYTGTSSVTLNGDLVSTVTDAITVNGAATIGNNILIQTVGAAGDDITFTSTINGAKILTLNSGSSGDIDLQGIIGGVTPLTGLIITNAHNVDAGQVTLRGNLLQSAGTGYTHFTGAVATTGASNSPGGSVNISTSGDINFDSTITTKGGTASANLGQNGGDLTLNSTTGNVTVDDITTSGSNGVGSNKSGGNAGAVNITSDPGKIITLNGNITASGGNKTGIGVRGPGGNVTLHSPTVLGANITISTGVTSGDITFGDILDGAHTLRLTAGTGDITFTGAVGGSTKVGAITINSAENVDAAAVRASSIKQTAGTGYTHFTGAVNTTGANNGVGGVVNITTAGDIIFDDSITTKGGTRTSVGDGREGGAITLHSSTGSITVNGTIDTSGSAGRDNTGGSGRIGGAGGNVTVTADAGNVILATITTNGGAGNIVGTHSANGGNAGAVNITSTGVGHNITLEGDINTVGGNGAGALGTQGAGGNVTFNSPTLLNTNIGIDTGATAGDINFNDTLNGAHNLVLTAGTGSINFSDTVGNSTLLSGLNASGAAINIDGGSIATSGSQDYNGPVNLGATTTLASAGISFNNTLDGNFDLTINDSGTTTFGGTVGGTTPLASLTTVLGGSTQINGGSVITGGDQNYNDPVTLGADATLTSKLGTVNAASTITTSNNDLTINTATSLTLIDDIIAGTGTVTLNPTAGGVSQSAATTLTADKLLLLGSGIFNLNQATNNINILAANITGGPLTYQDTDTLTIGSVSGTDGITTGGNDVTLNTGNTLTIANDIDAGTGTVTLNPTAGGAAETTGKILAANLLLTGGGTFTLNNAFNNVDILAANITGALTYQDADALTIGSVSGTDGITTGGNDVTIKSGALTLTKGITATGATITLDAAGITQASPVIAGSLLLKGTGTFTLDNVSNNVSTIAADVAGTLTYKDVDSLTVGNVVSTNGITANLGNITINALNGFLTITKSISAVGGSILLGTAEAAEPPLINADLTLSADLTALTSVTLNSADAITHTAGTITADSLDLTADSGIGTLASPLDSNVNTLNALNNTSGDIALTNTGNLETVSVVNNGVDIHLTVNSDLTVGNIQAPGQTVNLTANTGSILDDSDETNKITADTVNLTANNDIGGNTATGDIDIDSGNINATAGGNIYIESLGTTTFNTISGNEINLLSGGTTFLNNITGVGAIIIKVTSGDIQFTGTVRSTTSGAEITTDNGSIFASGAGPHLITNGDTYLDTPNGTITAIGNHLNLTLNSGFLVLNIGGAVGGVSGRLDGSVPSLSSILLQPSSFPSPLYPPGRVYFNGIFIWPSASTFANSQSNTLLGRYSIPVNFQAFLINTADTRLALFYQPLTELDASAFDAAMDIGEGTYEFMGNSLNLLGHEGLLPVFEDIKKKNKKR
ncbi:MAG: hypothetical protein PHJ00_00475 [Candidatus Omnitrophica bacterium]|nr:hypothetical protein [Candidatus Omnitrophota bacterium]